MVFSVYTTLNVYISIMTMYHGYIYYINVGVNRCINVLHDNINTTLKIYLNIIIISEYSDI